MALPGGNYTAFSGLDLDLDPNVAEYEIHPTESSFRFWSTPLETTKEDAPYETEATECFTAMTFQTASIGNYTFNLGGSDELVWASNGRDSFVNYHLDARARFSIDWTTGEATLPDPPQEEEEEDHDDHDHEEGAEDGEGEVSVDQSKAAAMPTVTVFGAVVLASILNGI